MTEGNENYLTEDEFQELLTEARTWIKSLENGLIKMAPKLARLSRVHKKKLKEELRNFCSADHIERIILYGKEKMDLHLAQPKKVIAASIFRRLSERDQSRLNNTEFLFVIVTENGIVRKTILEMNPWELNRIMDATNGKILNESEQRKVIQQKMKQVKMPEGDIELVIDYTRTETNEIILKGERGGFMRASLKTLKRFLDGYQIKA